LTINGATYLETVVDNSVTWTRLISQIGQGAATFYATADWDDWLTPGRVCVIEKVTNHTIGDARLLACFIIEDIEPAVSNGVNVVNVRGPGVESLDGQREPDGNRSVALAAFRGRCGRRPRREGSVPGNPRSIGNLSASPATVKPPAPRAPRLSPCLRHDRAG